MKEDYGVELRHFALVLDENIDGQMSYISEHDINNLSISPGISTCEITPEEQYHMAYDIVEKLNNKLLCLTLCLEEFETLDILDLLPDLRGLRLHCILKKPYDFKRLPKLESLRVWYAKAFSSIFDCPNIKRLEILHIDESAADCIKNLFQLECLAILKASIKNIDGTSGLSALKELSLRYLPKLESIYPAQTCKNIEDLYIQNCKRVRDWEIIGSLSNLKSLCLENCGSFDNINFLKPLEDLEFAGFVGTKIVNGNVSWLYEKPKIKNICLPWRKDFDITLEQLYQFNREGMVR